MSPNPFAGKFAATLFPLAQPGVFVTNGRRVGIIQRTGSSPYPEERGALRHYVVASDGSWADYWRTDEVAVVAEFEQSLRIPALADVPLQLREGERVEYVYAEPSGVATIYATITEVRQHQGQTLVTVKPDDKRRLTKQRTASQIKRAI